jgi:serine/threonine-protein kinase
MNEKDPLFNAEPERLQRLVDMGLSAMINTTITHYRVIEKIGKGGMGEVFRATDTKLDRDVAIKILPESFADDRNRIARFEREAKVLAALNHPNIAVIHGIEQSDEIHALVMELIEGETLGERLRREPMTVEEALACGKQIAEALEAAHEKGIVHRDLKPENVKISEDGHIKVLDFGLAKEVVDPASIDSQADSPTVTYLTTLPGVLLGTAPYMSPEQARAKPVDKRSDIWSFGCVLYECLTGKAMFQGEDVTETLASIIKGEPDWAALPESTPPTIRLLLRKCLNKDRKRRLQYIADARVDLEQALSDPSSSIMRLSDHALEAATAGSGHPWWLTTGIVVFACLMVAIIAWSLKPDPEVPPSPIRRISMDLGVEGSLLTDGGTATRLSPDGSTLAFIARFREGMEPPQIYLRRLDQLEATVIPTTRGADQFCFSPDGRWIAFRDATDNTLKKVAVTGGEAITLCESDVSWGLDWADNNFIFFGGKSNIGIQRISAAGGIPEPVTTPSDHGARYRFPQILPGGHAMLFSDYYHSDKTSIMIQRLPQGEPQQIWPSGHHARYLSSGHLLFMHVGTLYGVAFDLDTLTLEGRPVPLVEEVKYKGEQGVGHFDIAQEGSLVYVKDTDQTQLYKVEWVDREGERQAVLSADRYGPLRLSPTGQYVAYSQGDGRQSDVWIYDFERNVRSRRTFSLSSEFGPVWSPSEESIAFARMDNGIWNLYWLRADGSSEAQRLITSRNSQIPDFWHPTGDHLVFWEHRADIESNLRILALEGDDQSGWIAGEMTDFQADAFNERVSRISSDGRWIAYISNETGEDQVYVRPFPSGGGKTQVSLPGTSNTMPIWSRNGSELIFATRSEGGDGNAGAWQVFRVEYSIEQNSFIPGHPAPWKGAIYHGHFYGGIDLHPDGERLLVRSRADGAVAPAFDRVVLFENFVDYLREQVPRQ